MKTRQNTIISFLVGASTGIVFLTLNDPDKVGSEVINKFGWFLFFPSALILALWSRSASWLSALGMLPGLFVGACVRCLIGGSNIFPIAAAVWTALFTIPVVAGVLAGGLGSWWVRKIMKRTDVS